MLRVCFAGPYPILSPFRVNVHPPVMNGASSRGEKWSILAQFLLKPKCLFCWSFWVDPGFQEELSTILCELQVLGTCW